MVRRSRIHYQGALYHVICRGNNKEYVFDRDEDKKIYLQNILRYKKKYKFKLYAYCIMDNHVHLLIEVDKVPLSKIMQGIQQVFTMEYNKKYDRRGHVFGERYKSILCDKDEYLLGLVRYIHQNPVRAGIKDGFNYEWSSHRIYIEMKEDMLVDYKYVLGILSEDINSARRQYADLMEEEIDIKKLKEKEACEGIKEGRRYEDEEAKKLDQRYLMEKICEYYGIELNELSKKTRRQKIVDARKAFILLAKEYTDISNKKLAQELNLSQPTVSNILSNESNRELIKIIKL